MNRHGATIEQAIDAFLSGQRSEDREHDRMVSESGGHMLLWAWYANKPEDREIVIISCYRRE